MPLTPINPSSYITDTDPTDASAKTISSWYTTENRSDVSEESLPWMIAQGWEQAGYNVDDEGVPVYEVTRTQVDSQKILQDLTNDYTTAYNEGRTLNDSRYDEIVTLYTVMQTNSQTDWSSRNSGDANAESIILSLASALTSDYTGYEANTITVLSDYGVSILLQINTRFDNLLTTQAQSLTDRGMYNSTVWAATEEGIERERTLALTDATDKFTLLELGQMNTLANAKSTMRSKVIDANERVWARVANSADSRLASRNAVMQALLSFMERRTDGYPDLDAIGKLATALGAGNAAGFQP